MTKKYKYIHEEQSVDVRRWEITSNKKLTKEEIEGLCVEQHDYIEHHNDKDIEFMGTEYGDDCQITTYQIEPTYIDMEK
jgi:6-phosphogluconolactonase (cycloisomerase 2 family)|tara:strand:- start:447 stop:683 length:237 start_codon:yes stop_codon:yes gene_type:complete